MKPLRCLQRWIHCVLLAIGLQSGIGCMCFLHPVNSSLPQQVEACKAISPECRKHVYVFIVHGMDPLDYANLNGLRDYIQELGFKKTYYGQLFHIYTFENELRQIHKEDPNARFALIGFSFGANIVRSITQDVKKDGISIDLLVYLGGNTLKNGPQDHPENAKRLLNILAKGAIWNGDTFDDAENINLPDVYHFGSPTHPYTIQALARELAIIAATVPVEKPPEDLGPAFPPEPTPQPVMPRVAAKPKGWDFLRPVSRLQKDATASQPASSTKELPPTIGE